MKLLNARTRGVIDYILGLVLLVALSLFEFSPEASTASYILGAGYLVMSAVTNYPLGFIKWLSFPTHGGIELVLSVLLVLMPWLGGFSGDVDARNFFIFAGIALFGLWILSDYRTGIGRAVEMGTTDDLTRYRRAG